MALALTPEEFEKQLRQAIEARIADAIKAEADRAAQAVRDRIRADADLIALTILDRYDLSQNMRELIIRVRKEL